MIIHRVGGWGNKSLEREPICFGIRLTRALRQRGLSGEPVNAELSGGTLELKGGVSGTLTIAADAVDRLRLGYDQTKYERFYVARLWTGGERSPIALFPLDRSRDYGMAMRRLARQLDVTGNLRKIERGLTMGSALFLPAAVALVAILVGLAALFALHDLPGWQRAGFTAAVATLVPIFLLRAVRLDFPRSVSSLAELERYLPE